MKVEKLKTASDIDKGSQKYCVRRPETRRFKNW